MICFALAELKFPIALISFPEIPTSAECGSAEIPSRIVPFLIIVSNCISDQPYYKPDRRANSGNDPKSHGDFCFGPAGRLEMMMQWRHKKNFALEIFFARPLGQAREGLDYED